jgi:hypothetical protein
MIHFFKADRLQFGENCPDKNLRFDSQEDAIGVVRHPDGGAPEFPVRFQFEILAESVELQIDFDCVVSAGADRDFFMADYGDGGKISGSRGINDDPVCAAIAERLTAQIKQSRVQIE